MSVPREWLDKAVKTWNTADVIWTGVIVITVLLFFIGRAIYLALSH